MQMICSIELRLLMLMLAMLLSFYAMRGGLSTTGRVRLRYFYDIGIAERNSSHGRGRGVRMRGRW